MIRLPRIAKALLLIGATLLIRGTSFATPAFSRATGLECTTCHFGGTNRLTRVGRDFYMRGHRTRTENLGSIQDAVIAKYLSIGGENGFTTSNSGAPASAFNSTYELIAGGPLPENFSFFIFTGLGADASIDTGYLSYTTDPTSNSYAFFRAGVIKPTLLKTLGGDPSVSIDGPAILNSPVFANPLDTVPNSASPLDSVSGFSAGYHTMTNWTAELGVTNGPAGDGSTTQDTAVYGTLDKEFDKWGSAVGVYAYSGAFPAVADNPYTDNFTRVIGIGTLVRKNWEATVLYGGGHDDSGLGSSRSPQGGSLELAYNLPRNITPFAMYESFTPAAGLNFKTVTLGVSFRLSKIGRFTIEGLQTSGAQSSNSIETLLHWLF